MNATAACFVIPNPSAFPSGGNLYNIKLISALIGKELNVKTIDFEEFMKIGSFLPEQSLCFFDSLYLTNLKENETWKTFSLRFFLLLHHLPSMESGRQSLIEEEQMVLKKMTGFLVTSEFSKRYLLENGFTDRPICVVPPAIDFIPERALRKSGSIEAIMVANLIPRKGILPFLKQLHQLRPLPSNIKIGLIGTSAINPQYAKRCLELMARMKEQLSYLGPVSHTVALQYYKKANLFISTAEMETFGMALQEAVVYRLPILATRGGNVEMHIKEGINGKLFSDIPALVEGLLGLCTEDSLHRNLIAGAAEFNPWERYNWDRAADKFISFFYLK